MMMGRAVKKSEGGFGSVYGKSVYVSSVVTFLFRKNQQLLCNLTDNIY